MRALSRKARYALQALYVAAQAGTMRRLVAAELAERAHVPRNSLDGVLPSLTHAGILTSKKGKGGGYALLIPSDRVSIGQIIRLIDGAIAPLPCLDVRSTERCDECRVGADLCGTRDVMAKVRDAVARIVDGTTLADVGSAARRLATRDPDRGGSARFEASRQPTQSTNTRRIK